MDFSIILVSRNREEMLHKMVESIFSTSKLNNEIIIGCDSDADKYNNVVNAFRGYNVTTCFSKRDDNLHRHINKIAKMATGKWLFVLNDDCVLTQDGWDLSASSVLGDLSYGRTYDDSIDRVSHDYAAFPIVSRLAYEKLGFLMDETFGNHGGDVILYRIFKEAGLVVDLPFVKVNHLFHDSRESLNKRMQDRTAIEMIRRSFSGGFSVDALYNCDITDKVERLKC